MSLLDVIHAKRLLASRNEYDLSLRAQGAQSAQSSRYEPNYLQSDDIKFDEELVIDSEDGLPDYQTVSWVQYRDKKLAEMPYSILKNFKTNKKGLQDIDELWIEYNGVPNYTTKKFDYKPHEYMEALFDFNTRQLEAVKNKCGTGINSYRLLLKYALLFNIKKIHKIVEWDNSDKTWGAQPIPIYNNTPMKEFNSINPNNIFIHSQLSQLSRDEVILNSIMDREASKLYSAEKTPYVTSLSSPFLGETEKNVIANNGFFELVNTHFKIFLNRVTIKFVKYKNIRRG